VYKNLLFLIVCIFFCIWKIAADEVSFVVEVQGVTVNAGIVYGAVYSNDNSYKNHQPDFVFQGNSTNETLYFNLQIPSGEYVIEVYQDSNNNGRLDFGWFNIPKEPVGITNFNGRGIPGNFNKQKVTINNGIKIIIQIYKL
jgi:uncharacterized protein (DUF2141 family)